MTFPRMSARRNKSLPASFQKGIDPSWMVGACLVVINALSVGSSASNAAVLDN